MKADIVKIVGKGGRAFLFVAACFAGVQAQSVFVSDANIELASPTVPGDGGAGRKGTVALDERVTAKRRRRSSVKTTVLLPGRAESGSPLLASAGRSVLEEAVYQECARYKIDPALVFSLIWQESGFKLHAVSPKGARGPLQLMPETAAQFGVKNPHDPNQAVRGGVGYLVWLLDRFGGNVSLALSAYNAGHVAVEAYLSGKTVVLKNGKVINPRGIKTATGIPPYAETQNYVRSIAGRYRMVRSQGLVTAGRF